MKPFLSLLSGLLLAPFCRAQSAEDSYSHSQYIFYNGTITGKICYDSTSSSCNDGSLGTESKSYLFVGKNPPWDPNPFFFELAHFASEDKNGQPGRKRQTIWTNDNFYQLFFATAVNDCWVDDYCYPDTGIALINLNKSTIQQMSHGPSGLGYSVTGDQTTLEKLREYQQNSVVLPNMTADALIAPEIVYRWNPEHHSTYNVTFSNTSAAATVTLQDRGNHLSFSFQGERVSYFYTNNSDNYNPDYEYNDSRLDGNATIELDTSDPSMPQFRYTNGSRIYFWEEGDEYFASATPSPTHPAWTPTPTPTGAAYKRGAPVGGFLAVSSLVYLLAYHA